MSKAVPRSPQEHARARRLAVPSPIGGAPTSRAPVTARRHDDASVPTSMRGVQRVSIAGAARAAYFEDVAPLVAEPTFAVGVSHCPWLPDRVANMALVRPLLARPGTSYTEVTDRAKNWVWSRKLWGWGAAQLGASHVVFLQDDLRFSPAFWAVLEAMVRARPNRVISLVSNHPMSERALVAGHPFFTMCECLGTGYVFPSALLHVFLDWRDRMPVSELAITNEDFQITRWLFETGRKVWCPIPTVLQTQDDAITSTTPVDGAYAYRRSYVDWEDPRVAGVPITSVDYWRGRPGRTPPDFGTTVERDYRVPGPQTFSDSLVQAAHRRISAWLPPGVSP
jgi:hypothetical protein